MPGGTKLRDSTEEEVKAAVAKVAASKDVWAKLPAAARLELLKQIRTRLIQFTPQWVEAGCQSHGYMMKDPEHAHLISELYVKGPFMTGMWLNSFINTYESLASTGQPPKPLSVSTRPNGSAVARVFPWGVKESVFAGGATAELVLEGKEAEQFNPLNRPVKVLAVLAAGNFDAATDILSEMFIDNNVVVFKTNPVNQATTKIIQQVLAPLDPYLQTVVGSVPQGQWLVSNALIEEVVMTGSCRTYDAIVWGNPDAPLDQKKEGKERVKKPVKAELGSVNPWIIVPGRAWSAKEIDSHAQFLAAVKMFNNGHICASPQVLVTSKNWPQRQEFLDRVRHWLTMYPATVPYYPNCDKSYKTQKEQLQKEVQGQIVCEKPVVFDGQQNPLFATGLTSMDAFVVHNEAFCPVLAEVALDVEADPVKFMAASAEAVSKCWGSLTVSIMIDDDTRKANAEAFEKYIDDLEFGAVGINQWGGMAVSYGQLVWGAFPGRHTSRDIQSGVGKLGNSFCLKGPAKSIVRHPFMYPAMQKVPVKGAASLAQAEHLTAFGQYPSTYTLTRLLANVITGF